MITVTVCLSFCQSTCISQNHLSKLIQILCVYYLWLWLVPPEITMQYIVYLWFYLILANLSPLVMEVVLICLLFCGYIMQVHSLHCFGPGGVLFFNRIFFLFFLSPMDLRDGSTDREPL